MGVQQLEERLNQAQRENRFKVVFSLPAGVAGDIADLELLAKSAVIPGKTRGQITVNRLGRQIRLRGDQTVTETFDITFYLPRDNGIIQTSFEQWYQLDEGYKVQMNLQLLDINNEIITNYELQGVQLVTIPDLTLDHETTDSILQYPVTLGLDFINPV